MEAEISGSDGRRQDIPKLMNTDTRLFPTAALVSVAHSRMLSRSSAPLQRHPAECIDPDLPRPERPSSMPVLVQFQQRQCCIPLFQQFEVRCVLSNPHEQ